MSIKLGFLPDLAELEWQVTRAFHSRQIEALDSAIVSSWRPEELPFVVLRFQPAVAVVVSEAPIGRIWLKALETNGPIDVCRRARRSYVLVRRAGFSVQCDSLTAGEARTLMALMSGRRLGKVTEELSRRIPPARVSGWFARWMALGLVIRGSGPREVAKPAVVAPPS